METRDTEGVPAVRLYVRESLPTPAAQRAGTVSERLETLATTGVVASVEEVTWPNRVPGDVPSDPRAVFHQVSGWAAEHGVELSPFFSTRECYRPGDTDRTDWLVLPALCLLVHEDGDPVAVYPHRKGDTVRTVEDGLDALAEGAVPMDDEPQLVAD